MFLLDACESVGQLALGVGEIGCDLLSASGRKLLRAPCGTGFLYVHRDVLPEPRPPFLGLQAAKWHAPDGHVMRDDARRFETWERYVAGQIGLGVAADYATHTGVLAIEKRVVGLAATLRAMLAQRPGTTVLDVGRERCGLVTFVVNGHDPAALKATAAKQGVNVSVTSPRNHGYDAHATAAAIRASPHYYNTELELEQLIATPPPPRVRGTQRVVLAVCLQQDVQLTEAWREQPRVRAALWTASESSTATRCRAAERASSA